MPRPAIRADDQPEPSMFRGGAHQKGRCCSKIIDRLLYRLAKRPGIVYREHVGTISEHSGDRRARKRQVGGGLFAIASARGAEVCVRVLVVEVDFARVATQ